MSDLRVLAGLQLAHSLTENADTQRSIESAWQNETDSWNTVRPNVTERIRAWTPPDAPDLAARVAELERFKADVMDDLFQTNQRLLALEQHPEPPAPDDPDEVCTCGHPRKSHGNNSGFILCRHNLFCKCVEFTPKPAPDDPVCAREGCGHRRSQHFAASRLPSPCRAIVKIYHDGRSDEHCPCNDFLPAPAAELVLDPVRVEAATVQIPLTQEHVDQALAVVANALRHPDTFFGYEDDRASIQFAMWLLDRVGARFAYLNGGAS